MNELEEKKKEEIFFFHGTTEEEGECESNHRFTVAGKYEKKEGEKVSVLKIGISICAKDDQFSRKIGREKATERLNNDSGKGIIEIKTTIKDGNTLSLFSVVAQDMLNGCSREGLLEMFNLSN